MQTIIEEVVGKEDELVSLLAGKLNLTALAHRPKDIFEEEDDE